MSRISMVPLPRSASYIFRIIGRRTRPAILPFMFPIWLSPSAPTFVSVSMPVGVPVQGDSWGHRIPSNPVIPRFQREGRDVAGRQLNPGFDLSWV